MGAGGSGRARRGLGQAGFSSHINSLCCARGDQPPFNTTAGMRMHFCTLEIFFPMSRRVTPALDGCTARTAARMSSTTWAVGGGVPHCPARRSLVPLRWHQGLRRQGQDDLTVGKLHLARNVQRHLTRESEWNEGREWEGRGKADAEPQSRKGIKLYSCAARSKIKDSLRTVLGIFDPSAPL